MLFLVECGIFWLFFIGGFVVIIYVIFCLWIIVLDFRFWYVVVVNIMNVIVFFIFEVLM